jgi:dTDP-4-amino-4,6-dideoxygalactose transaminase
MKNSNGWLKSQYEKIKETVNGSIQEVLDTNAYINGPQVQQFQKSLEEYLDVKHVTLRKRNRCFTNCDDGLI